MQNLILECAVRALLIAICTGAVLFILRVKAARVRHIVWMGVVVSMLALPVWTAWGPRAAVRVLEPAPAPAATSAAALPGAFQAETPKPQAASWVWSWRIALAAVYLLGFCALMTRLGIGTVRARVLLRRAANREGRLTSDSCAAPMTVGWLKPTVILPACWMRWPEAQLNAVLTHEREHARWRDPLAQWLALLNRAVFWFHPLAWWLERRLSAAAEEACDAVVLSRGHNPLEYSEYLLEFARSMGQNGARVKAMGMAMPGAFLPQRIRRILEGSPAPRISRARLAGVVLACAVVSMVFMASAVDHAQAQTPAGGSLSGTVEDPSGARVPGCAVTVRDTSGATVSRVVSDPAGLYRVAWIAPGRYTVEYSMPGFARRRMEAQIEVGKPMRIDARLEIGQVTETIAVTGQKPAVPVSSMAQPAPRSGPVSVGGRVQAIRLLSQPKPVYPPELQQQGIEGTVLVRAIVSREGVPIGARVVNTGEVDPRLAQAALDNVAKWRYQPTLLNGRPVETLTTVSVEFRLEE